MSDFHLMQQTSSTKHYFTEEHRQALNMRFLPVFAVLAGAVSALPGPGSDTVAIVCAYIHHLPRMLMLATDQENR